MEFTKLLEERRSIRAFDPEKHVTAEQIQEIVQAAIQAPSWKNSQTTRYYALVTPEKVEEFSAKCLPEFNQKSSKGAALVVTAFVKDRSGFTQDGTPDNEVGNGWGYYDLGLHDENFILRARELGLDTLIMGIRDEKASVKPSPFRRMSSLVLSLLSATVPSTRTSRNVKPWTIS